MTVQDLERIEAKIDRTAAGAIAVSDNVGGIMFTSMTEVLEFAKLMAVSQKAVPPHLRANPGACLAVTIQALEWRMSPFSVANKSYEVNDRIAYESQLIHAVIEARAPLKGRLRGTYSGTGAQRSISISGILKSEVEPFVYDSPPLAQIKKKSPLWVDDPDQQLWYYATRSWARKYCPDVLMGIYSVDELEDADMKDVTPAKTDKPDIGERLKGSAKKGRGFNADGVSKALAHNPGETLDASKPSAVEEVEAELVETGVTHAANQQLQLDQDAETEITNKKLAVERVTTKDELKELVSITTAYLKDVKRTDLLNDFLSAASAREKKLEV